MISLYKIEYFYNLLFKKDYYYLISMSVYHIELILFGILGLIPSLYKYKTYFPLYFDTHSLNADFLNYEIGYNWNTYFYTALIVILDFIFLFMVRYEINVQQKKHNTKYCFYPSKKLLIVIELMIFYFSIGNPVARMILYFLSFNTIQIFITYRIIMRYIPFMKQLFILGSYIYIILLTLTPFYVWINFIIKYLLGLYH